MKGNSWKADLHVHSKYSKRPSEWILQKIGCAESYTEPLTLYTLARQRGMDVVTITDHNTLAGSLEIAHLEHTFVSEEITTYFPEDGCKLHVLAYNITEHHHAEISRLRENVYDLTAYLNQEQIVHAIAHAMFSVNDRLTVEHFEQLVLLFKTFELNGTHDNYQNTVLREILQNLTPQDLEDLANKHQLTPYDPKPWEKCLIGGSDDHSSVNIASQYTEVAGASSVKDFLSGITQNKSLVLGRESNPKALAHTFYSIAYQFYKSRFSFGRYINKEVVLRFADRALLPLHEKEEGFIDRLRGFVGYHRPGSPFKSVPKTMQSLLLEEARDIIWADFDMCELLAKTTPDPQKMWEVWFRFVNTMSNNMLKQSADSILESLSGANLFDIFHSIGSVGSLYTMLVPYFLAYTLFTKDRRFCRHCYARFHKNPIALAAEQINVAHFTDTFDEINGVALTLKKYVEFAQKHAQAFTLITCGAASESAGVANFAPLGTFEVPLYPGLKLYYPSLLKMLNYCYEQDFTLLHAATPGPIGLVALAIARILQLPIYGTYHTALPQYAHYLSDDPFMEDLMWRYVLWYYGQMDMVYVSSRASRDELVAKGLDPTKIRFFPRGIDVERFHPAKRNGFFQERFGISLEDRILLYVGRISREKNLPALVNSFKNLIASRDKLRLVLTGDGPYLNEMKETLQGLPVIFTGVLDGDELAQAYASSDLFIFPSTTDTFGNVVLEAQASGVPVIVTDKGGPKENLIPNCTGLIVPAETAEALTEAINTLLEDPHRLQTMKQHARQYAEKRSIESAYLRLWESYQNPVNLTITESI